jgi:acetyl esterase/lipase
VIKKAVKKIVPGLILLVASSVILMLTPRIWSALNPGKPPTGYFFLPPTYLAVYAGIESQAEKSPQIPENLEVMKDIEYKSVGGKSLLMDFYHLRNSPPDRPLLVFIHGGGWSHGDRSEYLGYALYFAGLGYATATVTYRVVKDAPYPACAEDIRDAVSFLFMNSDKYRFDPDRVALIGGSAGAHLAMLAAYGWKGHQAATDSAAVVLKSHKIKAVVDMYGPVDLTTAYAREHSMVTRLMACSYKESPQMFAEASPLTWVSKDAPPTLILHGTRDMLVPVSQAGLLKQKLDSLGIPNVYRPLPGWPHTTDLVRRVNDYFKVTMRDFFEKHVLN